MIQTDVRTFEVARRIVIKASKLNFDNLITSKMWHWLVIAEFHVSVWCVSNNGLILIKMQKMCDIYIHYKISSEYVYWFLRWNMAEWLELNGMHQLWSVLTVLMFMWKCKYHKEEEQNIC